MADVVGVVFQKGGRVYYFDPDSVQLVRGDQVVVQTMRGTEVGEVVDPPHEIPDEELPAPLKRVVRRANDKDLDLIAANTALREKAIATCRELIAKHGLEMKLVDAEIAFGGGKITFSFFSEERVDFRALVADLAKALKMRIELRQIGAREEARLLGGLGPCGRHLCCTLFSGDQEPVSIRMAKEQNLPLNPMKISGLCGRLMCCLKYEQDQYVCFRKEAPSRGSRVQTDRGEGVVIGYQVPKDALTLRFDDGSVADVPIGRCSCGGVPCRAPEAGFSPVVCTADDDLEESPAEEDLPVTLVVEAEESAAGVLDVAEAAAADTREVEGPGAAEAAGARETQAATEPQAPKPATEPQAAEPQAAAGSAGPTETASSTGNGSRGRSARRGGRSRRRRRPRTPGGEKNGSQG
ncbi:MAG: stage 0 sporulation family protein [Actinobacteria bacterium]|nr:stage 0 sporulation family protein [Actinomycetota bacterium]